MKCILWVFWVIWPSCNAIHCTCIFCLCIFSLIGPICDIHINMMFHGLNDLSNHWHVDSIVNNLLRLATKWKCWASAIMVPKWKQQWQADPPQPTSPPPPTPSHYHHHHHQKAKKCEHIFCISSIPWLHHDLPFADPDRWVRPSFCWARWRFLSGQLWWLGHPHL